MSLVLFLASIQYAKFSNVAMLDELSAGAVASAHAREGAEVKLDLIRCIHGHVCVLECVYTHSCPRGLARARTTPE
jgi:hypothetical protein